jgi:hypothetical protein
LQTKFSIEVVVDYRDKSKLPAVATAVKRAAARLNAAVQLLADGQHPLTACYADDFFAGRVELEYLHEQILQEEAKPVNLPLKWGEHPADDEPLSDEFLKAFKGE